MTGRGFAHLLRRCCDDIATRHPGEILFEEFLKPRGISQNQIGRDLGVSRRRINEIIHGKRSITADTALRLSIYFGNSASFWLGLQLDYDLKNTPLTLHKFFKSVGNDQMFVDILVAGTQRHLEILGNTIIAEIEHGIIRIANKFDII